MTSRSGPFSARHERIRRYSVRRMLPPISGWRRRSSSRTAIGRMPRGGLQDRHHLALPDARQRIGPASAARLLLLGRQAPICLKAIAAGRREPCLRHRRLHSTLQSVSHVQPHLLVVMCWPGNGRSLFLGSSPCQTPTDRQTGRKTRPGGTVSPLGLRPRCETTPPAILTLIDGLSHLVRRAAANHALNDSLALWRDCSSYRPF
jgi:hypothetical protein